jgi:hypothetical protein
MLRRKLVACILALWVAFLMGSAISAEAQPDLVITNLQGPTIVNLGDYFRIFATVKNQGTTGSGPFRVVFYFSTDSTINTGDYLIPMYCDWQELAPGAEVTCGCYNPCFWCPNTIPLGIYYLGAILDDQSLVAETNESNNTRVADTGPVTIISSLGPEVVTTPGTPAGPANGTVATTYHYSTQSSISSLGHSVQYFFDWGDGTNSDWLPANVTSASKSWDTFGTYSVKVQARCSVDTSVVSNLSGAWKVTIGQTAWTPITPPPVSQNWWLQGIHLTSSGEGWAVGMGDPSSSGDVLLHFSGWTWTSVIPPSVSSNYVLSGVHFTSPSEGWAVGTDDNGIHPTGALIHYSGTNWNPVTPPTRSADWRLSGVYFPSSSEGWAVGEEIAIHMGLLLHYSGGAWTFASPPPTGTLSGVHFTSLSEGWAVGGVDAGVLLHYSAGTWTSVTPPTVSAQWHLRAVYFTSPDEGWAVGADSANSRGVLLHYSGGNWTSVAPPPVSSNWNLNAVNFTSPDEGWAVGADSVNHRGVLLHYSAGEWTSVIPPFVSSGWDLRGVYFTSAGEGWAVGTDGAIHRGILLHYSVQTYSLTVATNPSGLKISVNGSEYTAPKTFDWIAGATHTLSAPSSQSFQEKQYTFASWSDGGGQTHDIAVPSFNATYTATFNQQFESVSTPALVTGPTSGATGANYAFSTGGAASSLGHAVEYQFDWKGDGSDLSSWGASTQSKTWSAAGAYSVRARARCATDTSVISAWSQGHSITISATPVETVSTPTMPAGPAGGSIGNPYSYSTGGSISSLGHTVEYQFDWKGDESDLSSWGASTQSKTWSAASAYSVRARARCKTDTSIVSQWSNSLTVIITADAAPDLTGQWLSFTQTCRTTSRGTQCRVSAGFSAQNIGNMNAPSAVYVSFYLSGDNTFSLDDTFLKKLSAGKLKKGTSKKITLSVNLPVGVSASGKYAIAVVDSQNGTPESNENNNRIAYGPVP